MRWLWSRSISVGEWERIKYDFDSDIYLVRYRSLTQVVVGQHLVRRLANQSVKKRTLMDIEWKFFAQIVMVI